MYGIGYTNESAAFIPSSFTNGWGAYVAADGDARIWFNGSTGNIDTTGDIFVNSNKVWHAGNDG